MAVNVRLKRSAVQRKVPITSALELGEVAINTYDGNIFFKRNGANGEEIVKISGTISNDRIVLTTTTANQIVDSFSAAVVVSVKYVLTLTHATLGIHSTELLLVHDGTDTFTTEYGTIWSQSSLGTFTTSISSGTVRLQVTPVNTNTTINVKRVATIEA